MSVRKTVIAAGVLACCLLGQPSGARAQASRLYDHNGSLIQLTVDGTAVTMTYLRPRPGLVAAGILAGAVLFIGAQHGSALTGLAYAFKSGCSPAAYRVTGSDLGSSIVLRGPGPVRKTAGCDVERLGDDSPHSVLRFDARPEPGMRG